MTHRATIEVVPSTCHPEKFIILIDGTPLMKAGWQAETFDTESEANAKAAELKGEWKCVNGQTHQNGEVCRTAECKLTAARSLAGEAERAQRIMSNGVELHPEDALCAVKGCKFMGYLTPALAVSTPPVASAEPQAVCEPLYNALGRMIHQVRLSITEAEEVLRQAKVVIAPAALSPAQAAPPEPYCTCGETTADPYCFRCFGRAKWREPIPAPEPVAQAVAGEQKLPTKTELSHATVKHTSDRDGDWVAIKKPMYDRIRSLCESAAPAAAPPTEIELDSILNRKPNGGLE